MSFIIGIIKQVRHILFVNVRAANYRVLRFLNPDYQGGMVVDLAAKQETVPQQSKEKIQPFARALSGGVQKTVLLNSDRSDLNSEVLLFALSGMGYNSEDIAYLLGGLIKTTSEMTLEDLNLALEKALHQAQVHEPTPYHLSLYSRFLDHKREVLENKRAYLVNDRLYPNAVFWPNPVDDSNKRSLFDERPISRRIPIIDKSTRIVSAGSCFATEIAHYLIANGFNYLVKEGNGGKDQTYEVLGMEDLPNASAAWGIIFNTPSFRQLVDKSFGLRQIPKIVWSQPLKGENLFFDPFRENIGFRSVQDFEANYDQHIAAARSALEEMDVFIITLGLNEVWSFAADGSVFSRSPWRTAPSLIRRRVLTVEENVNDLIQMTNTLRQFNPGVKVICTVSPVPLHATFRGDEQHVISANAHSKAILRVAAEEFVKQCPETYYFPSYEIVTVCTEHPWAPDQRHVSPVAVGKVMDAFVEMFVR